MTLKEYAEKLNSYLAANPKNANLKVVYSSDDEGNCFNDVGDWPMCSGFFDGESFDEDVCDDEVNAVCIN